MFDPPPGFTNGLFAASAPEGKVQITLVKDGKSLASIDVPPSALTGVVFNPLMAAAIAHQRKGSPRLDLERPPAMPDIPMSSIALAQSNTPNHACLVVGVGEVVLSFEIPNAHLRDLGQACLA